jgi:medium-chain acyl-[acyl-carrier-protein] hydrolase
MNYNLASSHGSESMENTTLYEETIRIDAFECDLNRKWKPASFFQHLTEAAGIHAALLGVGFDAMLEQNLFWVHSRMKIKFFKFPIAGEKVTIRTWPKTIQQKLFFIRDFELLDTAGERLAAATSAWLVINSETRRLVQPQSLTLELPHLTEQIGLPEPLDRLNVSPDGEEKLCLRAGYSAVDLVGHVNNSRYVEWICDAFEMETYNRRTIDWLQINYDHEIRAGEEVSILARPAEEDAATWELEGINRSSSSRAFEAVLHWRD